MRKTFLLPLILWATMLVLFSCQKEFEKQNTNNTRGELISKVNGWLDKQKSPIQPNKAANIDLLKDNLNFTELRFEDLNQSEKFLIIPVNEDYETKKNIDKKTVLILLLVMDKSTNIIRGNLVLYSPEDNHLLNEIPKHTFFKMYNNKSLDCNGLFNFLSVTGRRMYQREYKDGKLHSFGYVKASNNKPDEASNQAVARTETDCTHYYYILTWWIDGVPVYQEAIYLGSICVGGCDDPMNQTLCPDDGGGGGGGGSGGGDSEVDMFDLDAESAIISQVYSISTQAASQSVSFSTQEPDESQVPFSWVIVKNSFNLWQVTSSDIAKGYNSTNTGAVIHDIEHISSAISGQTFWCRVPRNSGWPCIPLINLSWQETSSLGTLAPNYKSATMSVSGALKNWGITISSYTQKCTVNAV